MRFTSSYRLLAGVLMLLFVSGRALVALHLAVVPHRLCVEHGAAEHDARSSTFPLSVRGASESSVLAPLVLVAPSHESCDAAARTDIQTIVPSATASETARLDEDVLLPREANLETRGVRDVVGYAPKLSPPSLALVLG